MPGQLNAAKNARTGIDADRARHARPERIEETMKHPGCRYCTESWPLNGAIVIVDDAVPLVTTMVPETKAVAVAVVVL